MSQAYEEGKSKGHNLLATPPSNYSDQEKQDWEAGHRDASQSAAPTVHGMIGRTMQEHPGSVAIIVVAYIVCSFIYDNGGLIERIITLVFNGALLLGAVAASIYIARHWFNIKAKWVVLGMLGVGVCIISGDRIWRKLTDLLSSEAEVKQPIQQQHRTDSILAGMVAADKKWNDSINRVDAAEKQEKPERTR